MRRRFSLRQGQPPAVKFNGVIAHLAHIFPQQPALGFRPGLTIRLTPQMAPGFTQQGIEWIDDQPPSPIDVHQPLGGVLPAPGPEQIPNRQSVAERNVVGHGRPQVAAGPFDDQQGMRHGQFQQGPLFLRMVIAGNNFQRILAERP